MFIRQSAILIVLFLSVRFCFAQETDYLVLAKGDTLRGKVKIISFDADQAQVTVDTKKKVFQAYQIKSLRMDDQYYAPVKRAEKYRIMKLVKSGYLSLYGFREPNQTSYEGVFLIKRDGSSMDLPNLGFKKFMSQFLSDCPDVADKIRNTFLAKKDIEQIVTEYNDCVGANTRQRYKETVKPAPPAGQVQAKMEAASALRRKIEGLPDFENRKNSLDLLDDIQEKLKNNAAVPPYLTDGLNGYLKNNEQVQGELQKLLDALKAS